MGAFLEIVYDVLFRPVQAMRQISWERRVWGGAAAFLLGALVSSGAVFSGLSAAGYSRGFILLLLLYVMGSVVIWFLGTGALQLFAELFGGRGRGLSLLAALGFAHLPRIFLAPLWLLTMFMPAGPAAMIGMLVLLAVSVWVLILEMLAIRETHNFSTGVACAVLVAPVLMILAVLALSAVLFGAALWHNLNGW